MIFVMGNRINRISDHLSETGNIIFTEMNESDFPFHFAHMGELLFDIKVRENIIKGAYALHESGVRFSVFRDSYFNPKFWRRTSTGYLLRIDVKPSEAILDIFQNGDQYSFECSTAIVVIYYYAVLHSLSEQIFNKYFTHLHVWDWSYDNDLKIITRMGTHYIPGDVLYFYNPDHAQPVWIGENTVYLGEGKFFGHGIGIGTEKEIIEALNTLRKPNSNRSAYLLPQHSRLDTKYLASLR